MWQGTYAINDNKVYSSLDKALPFAKDTLISNLKDEVWLNTLELPPFAKKPNYLPEGFKIDIIYSTVGTDEVSLSYKKLKENGESEIYRIIQNNNTEKTINTDYYSIVEINSKNGKIKAGYYESSSYQNNCLIFYSDNIEFKIEAIRIYDKEELLKIAEGLLN
jgi:hypothetical protein